MSMDRQRRGIAGNQGFTVVELLVAISIIALLVAMLLPTVAEARETGKRAVCLQALHQLDLAMEMYSNDQKQYFVRDIYLGRLNPYCDENKLHRYGCPSKGENETSTGWGGRSFGISGCVEAQWSWDPPYRTTDVTRPNVTAIGGDCYTVTYSSTLHYELETVLAGRHKTNGMNFIWFDGHGKFLNTGATRNPNATGGSAAAYTPDADWRKQYRTHTSPSTDTAPPCSIGGCFWHPY